MSIMNKLFNVGQPASAAPQQQTATAVATPAQAPNVGPAANPASGTPGNIPEPGTAPQAVPPVEPTADSPLEPFKDIWDTVPSDPNAPNGTPEVLDPAKLQEVVGKANFSNAITPEDLAAISQGGEGAVTAFQSSMNSVAQNVMMQSTLAANKMVEQAITKMAAAQDAKLPELVRQQSLANSMRDSNPLYSNPAVKPVIEAVQAQLAAKNPSATPAELATMAQNFIEVMGEQFAPKSTTPAVDASGVPVDDTDWNDVFGVVPQ